MLYWGVAGSPKANPLSLLKVTQWPPAAFHTKLHSTGVSGLPSPISSHSALLSTGFLPPLKQNKLFLSHSLCTYCSFWLKIWSDQILCSQFCLDLNGLPWAPPLSVYLLSCPNLQMSPGHFFHSISQGG